MEAKIYLLTLMFGLCLNLSAQIPTDSLVGYWPFNGNANDESGNGNDGTVYGATLTVDRFGNVNSAYSFDGTNDYILANPILPISNQDRSISVWFNTTSGSGSNGWYVNTMTSWGSPSDNNLCSAAVYKAELMFNAFGVSYSVYTGQIVNDSNWHNTVITYDGLLLKVFLDTLEVASESRNLNTVNSSFYIGRRVGQDNQFMDGLIDDIRIYNRALTSEEVNLLYNEGTITGINTPDNLSTLKVYPNPAKDVIFIHLDKNYSSLADYTIKIINSQGQSIFESNINKQLFEVDVSKFGHMGLYIIQIIDNTSQIIDIRKVVLE